MITLQLDGLAEVLHSIISPPRVPIKRLEPLEHRAITLGLLEGDFVIILVRDNFLSTERPLPQIIISPLASPDTMPPFSVSQRALTAELCSLKGFIQVVPFQERMLPFCIPLTIVFPHLAKLYAEIMGTFPKIPLSSLYLPFLKEANTTYLAQAAATISSSVVNLRAKITDLGPFPVAIKLWLSTL